MKTTTARSSQISFALPSEVKRWLVKRTERTLRSLNSEVVFILKQEMERERISKD